MVIVPSKEIFKYGYDSKKTELIEILNRENINYIDINKEFEKSDFDSNHLWLNDDTHLSVLGNSIIATAIEEDLLSSN